jgi:hypothetical protein
MLTNCIHEWRIILFLWGMEKHNLTRGWSEHQSALISCSILYPVKFSGSTVCAKIYSIEMKRGTILPCCDLWVYFSWNKLTYTLLMCWFIMVCILGTSALELCPIGRCTCMFKMCEFKYCIFWCILYFLSHTIYALLSLTALLSCAFTKLCFFSMKQLMQSTNT